MGAIAIAIGLLPGCVNNKINPQAPAHALLAADEPTAAAIGREVLLEGGTAADAAAAMALTMAVTLPSRVGLGGGGLCLVHDARAKETRTLDFRPAPAGAGGVGAPALLRGVYALQAADGSLRWEQIAVRAEALARSGVPVSRALAADLRDGTHRLTDPETLRLLAPNGAPLAEGARLVQPDLAATLSRVRRQGLIPFYVGTGADALAAGLGIEGQAVRGVRPAWGGSVPVELGDGATLHLADLPSPEAGKALAALFEAGQAPPYGPGAAQAAGFAVVDGRENAVACSFTMGSLFGTGRMVPGTGILASVATGTADFGTPALVTTRIGRTLFAAAASSDGRASATGPAALLDVALPVLREERRPAAVLAARSEDAPGHAAVVACRVVRASGAKDCQAAADPRAHGLAFDVELAPGT
ncbi:gamma-glutamyltransferase [Azospirillum sp. A39]|uniref:gamma-glutamyltransferase n=1 Tax=Azospirillum sp. A39 TaxID=3462279 RepID=UPI00404596E2